MHCEITKLLTSLNPHLKCASSFYEGSSYSLSYILASIFYTDNVSYTVKFA